MLLRLPALLKPTAIPEKRKQLVEKRHIAMNTLPNVTMMMEKYKSREGDIEISNQSGKGLKTWEWYDIQKWENGE